MGTARKLRPVFDLALLVEDMTRRGWGTTELARRACVSQPTVARFLSGEFQTARTIQCLARALGYDVARYLTGVEEVA